MGLLTKHKGYRYVVFNDYSKCGYAYFFSVPAYRRGHTNYESEILVEDRDGDGYYNWGLGTFL